MSDTTDPFHRRSGSVSTSVLERALDGDQEAFRRITELYSGLVYYWCRRRGISANDADDVGQHVFIAISQNLHSFRRDSPGQSFRAWVHTVSHSKIADFWRSSKSKPSAPGGDDAFEQFKNVPAPDDDEDDISDQLMELYRKAVEFIRGQFSERNFQAFWLFVVDGKSAKEVAAILNMSENSVFIAISRIKRRVRTEFGELIE